MNKKIFIMLLIVVLLLVGAVLLILVGDRKQEIVKTTQDLNSLPLSTVVTSPPPGGDTITIDTPGGVVSVRNFYKNPIEITPDRQALRLTTSAKYGISYYVPDRLFTISILNKPVEAAKKEAEEEFLRNLQISREDACKLSVWVGVPVSVDENLAGLNLGLSFCGVRP